MRSVFLAALFGTFLFASGEVHAVTPVEIQVLSPGVTSAGIRVLSVSFTLSTGTTWENGPEVVLSGGSEGTIQKDLTTGMPADVVVLQAADMDALDKTGAIMPGSKTRLGRVDFGVAVRAGAPHPDISTRAKFLAALLAAKSVAYNDPATGSVGGEVIAQFLTRPEFSGVKAVAARNGAREVAAGNADIALQSMGELIPTAGVEFVGYVPAYLQAHLEFSVGVLTKAAAPKEALAFVRYITAPKAAAILKANGVVR